MDLNDYVAIAISSIALVISLVTMVRARNSAAIATKQSHIDIKYNALSLAQIQQTIMIRLLQRTEALMNLGNNELTDAVSPMRTLLSDLLESSDKRMKWLSSLNSYKVTADDELNIRQTLGLLKERDALLISTEHRIEESEEISMKLYKSTSV